MTIQDQYISTLRQGQEVWTDAVRSLTENAQNAFGQSAHPWVTTDATAAIDQVFDFWKETLEVQREAIRQLVSAGVAVGESVQTQAKTIGTAIRNQAESAGAAFGAQVESATQAARQHAETVDQAAHDQAARKYDGLTKDELQDELGRRNLPKSGNVEELRERLVSDDRS